MSVAKALRSAGQGLSFQFCKLNKRLISINQITQTNQRSDNSAPKPKPKPSVLQYRVKATGNAPQTATQSSSQSAVQVANQPEDGEIQSSSIPETASSSIPVINLTDDLSPPTETSTPARRRSSSLITPSSKPSPESASLALRFSSDTPSKKHCSESSNVSSQSNDSDSRTPSRS